GGIGAAQPATHEWHEQARRSGYDGRVQLARSVLDGDDARAELVGEARNAARTPERVVQQHDVGPDLDERALERPRPKRQPVPVCAREGERGKLMATALVPLAASRHDQ